MENINKTMRSRRHGKEQGSISLVEIMIVIVILGILAAITIPLFDTYQELKEKSATPSPTPTHSYTNSW